MNRKYESGFQKVKKKKEESQKGVIKKTPKLHSHFSTNVASTSILSRRATSGLSTEHQGATVQDTGNSVDLAEMDINNVSASIGPGTKTQGKLEPGDKRQKLAK
ncbi:hypothetical protein RN001_001810 [Aquatica leii]|uniref:Uncharacterized protein n=1 Tax=Aquatica leii TaxID=1421715 RepID=A0AAN7SLI2_9COLE|nr:hypothetical protein RN001_001810 [Aquatica leii]